MTKKELHQWLDDRFPNNGIIRGDALQELFVDLLDELAILDEANEFSKKQNLKGGLQIGADNAPVKEVLTATATWDPPSMASGGGTASTSITVDGAEINDTVIASFDQATVDGDPIQITGHVSGADTVTVTLQNHTGFSVDFASGTLRVTVLKH